MPPDVGLAGALVVSSATDSKARPSYDVPEIIAAPKSIIRTYADFIGVPVYLGDDGEPANAVTAPWHRHYSSDRERKRAYYEFWEKKFLQETSLHVFAVNEAVEWDDFAQPDGKGHGRVRGVLAITDRRMPDVNARGIVDVYINRMFISAGNREVVNPIYRACVRRSQVQPSMAPASSIASRPGACIAPSAVRTCSTEVTTPWMRWAGGRSRTGAKASAAPSTCPRETRASASALRVPASAPKARSRAGAAA